MWDRTINIRDELENHEGNKNKDLSSTVCEYVSLECTPQVHYICAAETRIKETAETMIQDLRDLD